VVRSTTQSNQRKSSVSLQPSDNELIFDPSLLVPPSHVLLEGMLGDRDLDLFMTQTMLKLIFTKPENEDYLPVLLKEWGAIPEQIPATVTWVRDKGPSPAKFRTLTLEPDIENFKSIHVLPAIRRYKDYPEPILQFVSDEICAALQSKMPIFCTETSSWTIVNILRGIGAKVKSEVIEHARDKSLLFKKKKTWKKVLAITAGSAFAWVLCGPIGGLGALGTSAIYVAIEDP
jgi:hypothetical protein